MALWSHLKTARVFWRSTENCAEDTETKGSHIGRVPGAQTEPDGLGLSRTLLGEGPLPSLHLPSALLVPEFFHGKSFLERKA